MGGNGSTDSSEAIYGVLYSYIVASLGIVFVALVVVYGNTFVYISYSLLVGANGKTPFNFRLGSGGALWRCALSTEKEFLYLAESILQEKIANIQMGGLKAWLLKQKDIFLAPKKNGRKSFDMESLAWQSQIE